MTEADLQPTELDLETGWPLQPTKPLIVPCSNGFSVVSGNFRHDQGINSNNDHTYGREMLQRPPVINQVNMASFFHFH